MQPIEFIGIRGGHGATTVALAAAATIAAVQPVRLATHDRSAMCAIAGIAHDGLPLPIAAQLQLSTGECDGDVIDAGTLQRRFDDEPFDDEITVRRQSGPQSIKVGVLRGPDYLGLRTLHERCEAPLDGLVVLHESGRALDAADVERVTGREVLAVVEHTPTMARTLDAGLFVQRVTTMREFAPLRAWIGQHLVEEAA